MSSAEINMKKQKFKLPFFLFGSTMKAACELITSLGATVSLCLVCIELVDLNGRSKIDSFKCESIVTYSL
ncbi:Adenine phosphoribosyltransferase [Armadillidium vulgare]|nr:Adenine phosphoribosyltransferase [Armadillidium vulgare]